MKKIAIFTSFSDYQKAYSLAIIVRYQLKMLLMNGYEPTLIVHDTFEPEDIFIHPNVHIEKIPNVPCHNEVKKDDSFDEDVALIEKRLREILGNIDVCLTHDIIYQPACLKHNVAARRVARDLPVKWMHWIHSATSPLLLNNLVGIFEDKYVQLVTSPFPNAKYIYPNSYAIPAVARNFNIDESFVRHVPHPTDVCEFLGISREVEEVIERKNMLSADAMSTYPCRLDRGKQVQYVIKTMAMLKTFGLSVRVVVVDFHSTGGDKLTYRDELKNIAIDYGLDSDELTFTSGEREEWTHECPQEVVRDFQLISNVFILPSVSETYSLIAQEAAMTKQVMVLNKDFPPFRSIYGDEPIYRKYSSRFDVMADTWEALGPGSQTNTQYGPGDAPNEARKGHERNYHRDTAGMIAARLRSPEMMLSRRLIKERNLKAVFKNFIEPLFYE